VLRSLRAVKLFHTAVWAFFAASILAIPVLTAAARFGLALVFVAVVAVERTAERPSPRLRGAASVTSRGVSTAKWNFRIHSMKVWLSGTFVQ